MSFFSKVSSTVKVGIFLAECRRACKSHGSEPDSASLFVDMGKEILLSSYQRGLDPETAVVILSLEIINLKEGVAMNVLDAAHRYVSSYIRKHPGPEPADELAAEISKSTKPSSSNKQAQKNGQQQQAITLAHYQSRITETRGHVVPPARQELTIEEDEQEHLQEREAHAQAMRGGLQAVKLEQVQNNDVEGDAASDELELIPLPGSRTPVSAEQRQKNAEAYTRCLKEGLEERERQGLPKRPFITTKDGKLRFLKPVDTTGPREGK